MTHVIAFHGDMRPSNHTREERQAFAIILLRVKVENDQDPQQELQKRLRSMTPEQRASLKARLDAIFAWREDYDAALAKLTGSAA